MGNLQPAGLSGQELTAELIQQETTPQQEVALLLERIKAAYKRGARSEVSVLTTRYLALSHPNQQLQFRSVCTSQPITSAS